MATEYDTWRTFGERTIYDNRWVRLGLIWGVPAAVDRVTAVCWPNPMPTEKPLARVLSVVSRPYRWMRQVIVHAWLVWEVAL